MTQEEIALFTVPPHLGYGEAGRQGVPPNSVVQFQVQLISWITVVDVCRDGGIIKKILEKGNRNVQPGDLDELLGNYFVIFVPLIWWICFNACALCFYESLSYIASRVIIGDFVCNTVKYKVKLVDDTIVAQTPEEGIEFYMKDGNLLLINGCFLG